MEKFVQRQSFKDLNVDFDIDEGVPSDKEEYVLFYNERSSWGK